MLQGISYLSPQAIERMKTELNTGGKREEGEEEDKPIKVEYIPLDLSSFQSTTDCVRTFKEKNLPLHILINNAAVYAIPYSEKSTCFKTS